MRLSPDTDFCNHKGERRLNCSLFATPNATESAAATLFRAAMIYFIGKRFFADENPLGITSNAKTIRSSSDSHGIV